MILELRQRTNTCVCVCVCTVDSRQELLILRLFNYCFSKMDEAERLPISHRRSLGFIHEKMEINTNVGIYSQ